jgi:hypothetical protein
MNRNRVAIPGFCVLAGLLGSCLPFNTLNSVSSDAGRYSISGSNAFVAARQVMAAKCSSCHSYVLEYSEADWQTRLVVAGNPEGSPLFQRLKLNGLGGDMPPDDPSWSAAELQTIRTWIESL